MRNEIKRHIVQFFRKHPKINYIQKVTRYMNDKKFVNEVLKISCDPSKIKFTSYGNYNQNLNLYFINLNDPMTGFFAFYRNILTALCMADRFSFVPVINFENCPFKENETINETTNPFEYYFKQPGKVNLSELYKSQNVFLFDTASAGRAVENSFNGLDRKLGGGYLVTEEYIKCLASIAKKYIRLNDKTNEYIQTNLILMLYKNEKRQKVLGVHIRGTDYALKFGRHPVMVEVEEYFEVVAKIWKQRNYDKIFLATDDQNVLDKFIDKFKDHVIFYSDVFRSKEAINISLIEDKREHHHYLAGLEVLRDMHTLANCDGLIAGLSQVSIAARITKISMGKVYEDMEIINKGIVQ